MLLKKKPQKKTFFRIYKSSPTIKIYLNFIRFCADFANATISNISVCNVSSYFGQQPIHSAKQTPENCGQRDNATKEPIVWNNYIMYT